MDMEVTDDTRCRFNMDSYKIAFIMTSESSIYKRMSLKKARMSHKHVSHTLFNRFDEFHSKWLEKAPPEGRRQAENWLLGKTDSDGTPIEDTEEPSTGGVEEEASKRGRRPRTRLLVINNPDKSPYRPYCKYQVEATGDTPRPATSSTSSTSSSSTASATSSSTVSTAANNPSKPSTST
jgi:paired amphipathic helix protein Sin3a